MAIDDKFDDSLFKGLKGLKDLSQHNLTYIGKTYNGLLKFAHLKEPYYVVVSRPLQIEAKSEIYNIEFYVGRAP